MAAAIAVRVHLGKPCQPMLAQMDPRLAHGLGRHVVPATREVGVGRRQGGDHANVAGAYTVEEGDPLDRPGVRANSSRSCAQVASGITITVRLLVVGGAHDVTQAGQRGGHGVAALVPALVVGRGVVAEVVLERERKAVEGGDRLVGIGVRGMQPEGEAGLVLLFRPPPRARGDFLPRALVDGPDERR